MNSNLLLVVVIKVRSKKNPRRDDQNPVVLRIENVGRLRHPSGEDEFILVHASRRGMITVLIANDPSLVRSDPSPPLCDAPDLRVLGTVADHLAVIRAAHTLRPDVLLIESVGLSLSAVEVTQQVTAGGVHTRVVIVPRYVGPTSLIRTLRSGVAGVVLRPFERDELIHAVREVANGRQHLSPRLWRTLTGCAEKMRKTVTADAALVAVERRILELVAAGQSAMAMSARLSLPRTSVETHCKTLMQKLGLRTYRDLAVYALRWHIVAAHQHGAALAWDL